MGLGCLLEGFLEEGAVLGFVNESGLGRRDQDRVSRM